MLASHTHRSRLLACAVFVAVASPLSAAVIRVPQDARDLPAAIARVRNGDVIELAAGIYRSTNRPFEISVRRTFTVRAAAPGTAVLDGDGLRQILRVVGTAGAVPPRVTFEGLVFRNGAAAGPAGAVFLRHAEATFRDCRFEDNRALQQGGAIQSLDALLVLEACSFTRNRVDPATFGAASGGGALWTGRSRVVIRRSRFSENRSGWVGGAIYAFGEWRDPLATPTTRVEITGSELVDNVAEVGAGGSPGPSEGGAILAEDQTTLRITGSRVSGNRADFGGGLGVYRAEVELTDVVLSGNRSSGGASGPDAIYMNSFDKPDASTGGGAFDRRPAALTATSTLVEGVLAGGVGQSGGGCLAASGDTASLYGLGVPARGTAADHRARLVLRDVVFRGCARDGGFGGALLGELVDLDAARAMFLDSRVTGGTGGGGAVLVHGDSRAVFMDSVFAGNAAPSEGGALRASGSHVEVHGGAFLGNQLPTGLGVNQSRGASLFIQPAAGVGAVPPRDATGLVAGAVFAGEQGLPIFELDNSSSPVNATRYDGNTFFATALGGRVFSNPLSPQGRSGSTVSQLNAMTLAHAGAGVVDKSVVPNQQAFGPPRFGVLVAAPARPWLLGPAGDEEPARLAFAWSGGSATLDGTPLATPRGVLEALPGAHTLAVDGQVVAQQEVEPGNPCETGGCLETPEVPGFRFLVRLGSGPGALVGKQVQPCLAETLCVSGAVPGRTEVLVRVVGPKPNGFLWPTIVRLTTNRVEVVAEQTSTGIVRSYVLPAAPPGVEDLSGRVDRGGFRPTGALATLLAFGATTPPPPGGQWLSSPQVPGFRFKVRISGANGPVARRESRCLAQTLCVSGALPGRTELLLRVVGPRNGRLIPTLVTFSISQFEVWVEQTSTGKVRFYRLPALAEGDTLAGLVDRDGFTS
jgi:hypothetical protein